MILFAYYLFNHEERDTITIGQFYSVRSAAVHARYCSCGQDFFFAPQSNLSANWIAFVPFLRGYLHYMKLLELITQLAAIESEHPGTDVRFETFNLRPPVQETQEQFIVDVDYGRDDSDYCTIRVSSRPQKSEP